METKNKPKYTSAERNGPNTNKAPSQPRPFLALIKIQKQGPKCVLEGTSQPPLTSLASSRPPARGCRGKKGKEGSGSKLEHQNSLEGLQGPPQRSGPASMPRIWNRLPGDADVAGPGTTL